jgi:hypothetical protein
MSKKIIKDPSHPLHLGGSYTIDVGSSAADHFSAQQEMQKWRVFEV